MTQLSTKLQQREKQILKFRFQRSLLTLNEKGTLEVEFWFLLFSGLQICWLSTGGHVQYGMCRSTAGRIPPCVLIPMYAKEIWGDISPPTSRLRISDVKWRRWREYDREDFLCPQHHHDRPWRCYDVMVNTSYKLICGRLIILWKKSTMRLIDLVLGRFRPNPVRAV